VEFYIIYGVVMTQDRRSFLKAAGVATLGFSPVVSEVFKGYEPSKEKKIDIDPSIKNGKPLVAAHGTIVRIKGDFEPGAEIYYGSFKRMTIPYNNMELSDIFPMSSGFYIWKIGVIASNNRNGTCDMYFVPCFLKRMI
jgi:ribosomal protein L21E